MSNQTTPAVLSRLQGKKVCFNGKFDYGLKERLEDMAQAQQGDVREELDGSVDFLVLADLSAGKTVQKKALSLNAKGATIQVIDTDAFRKMVEPTEAQVLALIRGGEVNAEIFRKAMGGPRGRVHYYHHNRGNSTPLFTYVGENLDGVNLHGFHFDGIAFNQCTFTDSKIENTQFSSAVNCDFSGAETTGAIFGDVSSSRFIKAKLSGANFHGNLADTDFTAANLEGSSFACFVRRGAAPLPMAGLVFAQANLQKAKFGTISLASPDFDGADLSGAIFNLGELTSASFRKSNLQGASFINCGLKQANLSGANCRRANFVEADLTDARVDGADFSECNLRGAKLNGVDLSRAKNYNPNAVTSGTVGPALTELDSICKQAGRVRLSFHVRADPNEEGDVVGIDSSGLKYGWAVRIPHTMAITTPRQPNQAFSDAMFALANVLSNRKVRFETVDVSSTKSPKGGKELKELVISGISEAFAQPIPAAEELATATKAYREKIRDAGADARKQREENKKALEEAKKRELKKIEKTIQKQVGKVTDIATFLKALELRADKSKIDKATKMLKAEKFQLFNDVTDTHLNGVVKSQTDPDLVYACRIESSGAYACCTQNLNICGGLRGSICKHLLVLIVGLVKAGSLDPSTIDEWVAKTRNIKAELDKEKMGEIFIRYKGAEAGEVDWRPTETVPEDYYAL